MYLIIAIGWIYVVFMMSITEQSVVAGVMTFLLYGILPVVIIMYLGGSKQRRLKRLVEEERRRAAREASNSAPVHPPENEEKP